MEVLKPAPRRPQAFTLLEMMVVVSIIALLVSMLLPSLVQSRAKATQAICGTRLKGLMTAMHGYLQSYNDTFPVNGVIMPKDHVPDMYRNVPERASQAETNIQKWRPEYGALWTFLGGVNPPPGVTAPPLANESARKAFTCPDDWPLMLRSYPNGADSSGISTENYPLHFEFSGNSARVVQAPGTTSNPVGPGYWSYSVNSVLNSMGRFRNRFATGELPWKDPLRALRVFNPEFICFVEESDDSLFNDEVFDAPAYNGGDKLTNRHNNSGNLAMLDSSVQSWNASIFNNVPSAVQAPDGTSLQYVENETAMTSPITRMFFPDAGTFITAYVPQNPTTAP
jgi:prepilin-type N-terminal cleavage/methylation domain-containing protein/prepilin-type processing-associated H-X9-DG protein